MSTFFLLIGLSAVVSRSVAAWVLQRAERLRLVQTPNYRSSHVQPTPNGGGLGIVLAGTVAGSWLAWGQPLNLWAVIGLSLPLAVVGLFDDIRHLSARVRFGVQVVVCAGLLFALGEMQGIPLSPGPSPTGEEGSILSGWVLSALLLLAGVWWINLFNFMDGIDGIAASQAVFMLVAGAGLAAWGRPDVVADPAWVWMVCIAAATVGFLLLNWPPAKIFMGDVGSTYLAFMIFALALVSVRTGWFPPSAGLMIWLILGAVFVVDATVTLLTRMARGERWYEAHRSHVYQRLARRWGAHRPVTLLAIALNVLWLAPLAWACTLWPQWALAWVVLAYAPLVVGALALALGAGRADHA